MPNRDENNPDLGKRDDSDRSGSSSQSGSQPDRNSNEWLRDQVGEDHNLSGSSTYRTLPDQPDSTDSEESGRQDTKDRQSNR
jgi:hypothetical protein